MTTLRIRIKNQIKKQLKYSRYWLGIVLLFCAVVNVQGNMQTNVQEEIHQTQYPVTLDEVEAGRLLFKTDNQQFYQPAILLNTDMDMEVNGLIATVKLKQAFHNVTDQWMEGVYVFPLPEDASVYSMRIQIGERIIEGEIKEKQQARKLFEQAKDSGKRVSLVEQERPNLFTNTVANIGPDETIIVEISYLQKVIYDQGDFRIRFPMTITPRYIPGMPVSEQTVSINQGSGWAMNTDQVPDASRITPPVLPASDAANELLNPIKINAVINLPVPVQKIHSAYHKITTEHNNKQYHVRLTQGQVSMDRDFVLTWTLAANQQPQAMLFNERKAIDDKNEHYSMLMLVPPQQVFEKNRLPREVVFVIDTSGSMGGESIRQAKESLQWSLARLSQQDRFNIVEFNSNTRTLFPFSMKANQINMQHARDFVQSLQSGGGTEMAPALEAAMNGDIPEGYLRQIVFMTDGSVGNESTLFSIIHQQLKQARLFTVGIGSAPNSWFMKKAAQFGRGTFTYIGSTQEVRQKMSELFSKLEAPVISHLKVIWPDESEMYPQNIPDLYLGEPLVLTSKVPHLKGEVVIEGLSKQGPWQRKFQLNQGNDTHHGIATLWAGSKIEHLMDKLVQGTSETQIKPEVLDIALKHQILSKYTSFIAIDKTVARTDKQALKKEAIPNVQPSGQSPQSYAYPKTATPAMRNILLGLILIVSIIILQRLPCFNIGGKT